jgi:hypothetical protein
MPQAMIRFIAKHLGNQIQFILIGSILRAEATDPFTDMVLGICEMRLSKKQLEKWN